MRLGFNPLSLLIVTIAIAVRIDVNDEKTTLSHARVKHSAHRQLVDHSVSLSTLAYRYNRVSPFFFHRSALRHATSQRRLKWRIIHILSRDDCEHLSVTAGHRDKTARVTAERILIPSAMFLYCDIEESRDADGVTFQPRTRERARTKVLPADPSLERFGRSI